VPARLSEADAGRFYIVEYRHVAKEASSLKAARDSGSTHPLRRPAGHLGVVESDAAGSRLLEAG
jgi:hypothetical protein